MGSEHHPPFRPFDLVEIRDESPIDSTCLKCKHLINACGGWEVPSYPCITCSFYAHWRPQSYFEPRPEIYEFVGIIGIHQLWVDPHLDSILLVYPADLLRRPEVFEFVRVIPRWDFWADPKVIKAIIDMHVSKQVYEFFGVTS